MLTNKSFLSLIVWWLLMEGGGGAATVVAADIVLRPAAAPSGTIVRLGDVADLRGIEGRAQSDLAEIPLMPAPAPGTKQFVSLREIRDMLEASGVSLAAHRLSGAPQVSVGGETPEALRRRVGRLTTDQLRHVEDDLHESIKQHLAALAAVDEPWLVTVSLDSEQLRQLAEAPVPWKIAGGREPWIGKQTLTIAYETAGGKGAMTIDARVSLPEPVVVLTQAVARGEAITRGDVALAPPPQSRQRARSRLADLDPRRSDEPLRSVDDAIGKVAKRHLQAGQAISHSLIEAPILVRQGETVKVIAISHGIRITTEARAKQSGGAGELVYVETLQSRDAYAAQVSGLREVQVIGR